MSGRVSMSRHKSAHRKMPSGEQDNVTEEITYPQDELGPDDVSDIVEKLNIGTLRREQLKVIGQFHSFLWFNFLILKLEKFMYTA